MSMKPVSESTIGSVGETCLRNWRIRCSSVSQNVPYFELMRQSKGFWATIFTFDVACPLMYGWKS